MNLYMDLRFRIIKEKAIKNFAITIINEAVNKFLILKNDFDKRFQNEIKINCKRNFSIQINHFLRQIELFMLTYIFIFAKIKYLFRLL
jgi:hypothetical protein